VLPDDYQGRGGLFAPDMWLPMERRDVLNLPAAVRDDDWLLLFAHLRDGVTRPQAAAELDALSRQLSSAANRPATQRTALFYPMNEGHPEVRGVARFAWLALAIVGIVLLLACFNVTALLMARANERQREIGVRVALGAGRGRILRQLITEGIVLAILAGAATLVLAAWSGDLLATFSLPAPIPQRLNLGIDRTLVAFTALLVLIAGVSPAFIPALQATRGNLLATFRMDSVLGGRPSRTRNVLVVAQVAGSTLFLVAALLLVRSFLRNSAFDPGFDTAKTLVMQVDPSMHGYDAAGARGLLENLKSRLRSLPGVTAVAVSDRVPMSIGVPNRVEYSTDDSRCASAECRRATAFSVAPGHFAALGIPLVDGRDFTEAEMGRSEVVIVSEQLARQLWPGASAVGRTFRLGEQGEPVSVVGVTRDLKNRYGTETTSAVVYRTMPAERWAGSVTVTIRTDQQPAALLSAVREQMRTLDERIPVRVDTTTELMKVQLWPARTAAGFFLICGVLATVLATVGLFGVLYFTVLQRTREFGIRVALGATPRRLLATVLHEGLSLTVPGLLLGSIGAYVAARLVARALFGISPADPFSFSVTAMIQVLVALGACLLPAFKATRADPMVALRQD
jgi:predicted permease